MARRLHNDQAAKYEDKNTASSSFDSSQLVYDQHIIIFEIEGDRGHPLENRPEKRRDGQNPFGLRALVARLDRHRGSTHGTTASSWPRRRKPRRRQCYQVCRAFEKRGGASR
jgi:hypothetical protein